MIKRTLLFVVGIFIMQSIFAEIPDGYYDNAEGKEGYELKTALHTIVKTNHNTTSYTPGIWNAFETTDVRDDGKVWDTYSNCDFTFIVDQDKGSGGTSECEYFNREHSFPRYWFGGEIEPMNTDLFHIMPTDKYVNNQRGNLEYGEVSSPTSTFSNGSKIGPNTYGSFSGTVFEPIDEYKGDFARNYFYMATRYEDVISSWPGSEMLDESSDKCFEDWALDMLIEWHTNDPVSQKELDRNDAVYEIQYNRNPFIDYPEFVDAIFGTGTNPTGIANGFELSKVEVYPNPTIDKITVEFNGSVKINTIIVYSIIGKKVMTVNNLNTSKYTFSLSGFPKGIYIVEAGNSGQNAIQKIILK